MVGTFNVKIVLDQIEQVKMKEIEEKMNYLLLEDFKDM